MAGEALPPDYDERPERFRTARAVQRRHGAVADIHADVARRFVDERLTPVLDASFGSVALLYVLYHLAEPRVALAEAHRVLRPGGLVAVAAPSRDDSPELLPSAALTFDAELAPGLVGEQFRDLEVRRWDAPLLRLPSREAVRDYLLGKGVDSDRAAAAAAGVEVPLLVTKRGALVFGRRR